MRLARAIRLDDSDEHVFERAALPGEWTIPGTFAFSDWSEDDLTGKARQAFANGWLGLESFGRCTFVVVTAITEDEYAAQVEALSRHFVAEWGAPSPDAARPVAEDELAHMRAMCEDHPENTLLVVSRELVAAGVHEQFRAITPVEASLEQIVMPVPDEG